MPEDSAGFLHIFSEYREYAEKFPENGKSIKILFLQPTVCLAKVACAAPKSHILCCRAVPHRLICEFSGYKSVMNQAAFVIVVSFFAKTGALEGNFPAIRTAGDKKMIDKIGPVSYNIVSRYMCATPGAGV